MLKSANAGDLLWNSNQIFDLVINLKTAKAFGLTIPPNAADDRFGTKRTSLVAFDPKRTCVATPAS